jgi:hypothetical protein
MRRNGSEDAIAWVRLPQPDPVLGPEGLRIMYWIDEALPLAPKIVKLTFARGGVPARFLGRFLRVGPCVPWATAVAPARSV